jgi:hypothetical protein
MAGAGKRITQRALMITVWPFMEDVLPDWQGRLDPGSQVTQGHLHHHDPGAGKTHPGGREGRMLGSI